jgi:hypothetical protein
MNIIIYIYHIFGYLLEPRLFFPYFSNMFNNEDF